MIDQMTGEMTYREQQIAGAGTSDSDEAGNVTSDDVEAVLNSGTLRGQPLSKDMKRALEYMRDNFHDMTDESALEF